MTHKRKSNGSGGMIATIQPYAVNMRSKASPWMKQTRKRVGPAVDQAQQKMTEAVSSAATASKPYRKEAARRGRAAWIVLSGGDPMPVLRRRHRMRRILVAGGLIGVATGTAVAYWMLRGNSKPPWAPTGGSGEPTERREQPGAAPAPPAQRSGSQMAPDDQRETTPTEKAGTSAESQSETPTPVSAGTRQGAGHSSGGKSSNQGTTRSPGKRS